MTDCERETNKCTNRSASYSFSCEHDSFPHASAAGVVEPDGLTPRKVCFEIEARVLFSFIIKTLLVTLRTRAERIAMHIYVIHDRHASGRAHAVRHARTRKLLNGRTLPEEKKKQIDGRLKFLPFSIEIIVTVINRYSIFCECL